MIRIENERTLMAIVYKDYGSLLAESRTDPKNVTKQKYIQQFMEDIVSTLAYHCWSKLIG